MAGRRWAQPQADVEPPHRPRVSAKHDCMSLTTLGNWPSAIGLAVLAFTSVVGAVCVALGRWALGEAVYLRSLSRGARTPRVVAAICLAFAGGATIPCWVGLAVLQGQSALGVAVLALGVALASVVHTAFRYRTIAVVELDERYEALTHVVFAGDRRREVAHLARELGLPRLSSCLRPTLVLAALTTASSAAVYAVLLLAS